MDGTRPKTLVTDDWRLATLIFFFTILVTCALCLVTCDSALANNIAVENAELGTQNTGSDTMVVEFDLSWDNSWRDATNYDAAWVFIKYSTDGGNTWSHGELAVSGHSAGSGTGLTISAPSDNTGAFLYRSANGTGSVDTDDIQLVWDYGNDSVSDTDAELACIRVFAVEMVYIPEGSFYIGDGTSTGTLRQVASNTPVQITADPVVVKCEDTTYDDTQLEGDGILVDGDGGIDEDGTIEISNASYPTGYNAFYIMKYEVSQGEYRDFLNMLTRDQQNARIESQTASYFTLSNTDVISYRCSLRNPPNIPTGAMTFGCDGDSDGVFDESDDGEWCAMDYLSWADFAAYADWAALRPFTELEFEKACRGPSSAVAGEYAWAWGSTNITAFTSLTDDGTSSEASGTANANCNYDSCSPDGPVRCGIFATASSTREQAGASYYGAMELSANLWKRVVTLGNSTGRAFTGSHGDGELDSSGDADVTNWPGTSASGAGRRAGSWYHATGFARVSDRTYATSTHANRSYACGARAARTAE